MNLDSSFSLAPIPNADVSHRRGSDSAIPTSQQLNNPDQLIFGSENELLRAFLDNQNGLSLDQFFPVFIYGPAGSGKSELARWLAHQYFPKQQITCLSATDFFREFVDAIDLDDIPTFRESFLADDRVTVLDHFQDLKTRPRALDELEFLLNHSGRLIITCTLNSADLSDIPNRLSSRLFSGLSIPLSHPSAGIRQLILSTEFSRHNASISNEAAQWLAENIVSTIPEIKQVVSTLRLKLDFKKEISLENVQRVFQESLFQQPSLDLIAKQVARNQKIRLSDLTGQSRKRSMVQARGIGVYIAREIYQYKYEELGRYFGNRDHSTIMHAHRKFKVEIDQDTTLAQCVEEITLAIRQKAKV